jgi:HTH-type transcriptional regulator/antitoxin HigA
MSKGNADFRTPGQLIQALLSERGWSQRALAIVLDMDETAVSRICADKRHVDAKLALVLEDVFRIPAERFLELQRSFELAQARIVMQPDPSRADRAQLYGRTITDEDRQGPAASRCVLP